MLNRRHFVRGSSSLVVGGLLSGVASSAHASELLATSPVVMPDSGLSARDWLEVAEICQRHDDVDGLRAVSWMAQRAKDFHELTDDERAFVRRNMPRRQPRNAATTVAKKAVLYLLRYAAHKLPSRLRPIAWKIVEVVEVTTQFQEFTIAFGLQQLGVDHALAWEAARWVVLIAGI